MIMSRKERKLDRLKKESKGATNKVPTCAVPMHAPQTSSLWQWVEKVSSACEVWCWRGVQPRPFWKLAKGSYRDSHSVFTQRLGCCGHDSERNGIFRQKASMNNIISSIVRNHPEVWWYVTINLSGSWQILKMSCVSGSVVMTPLFGASASWQLMIPEVVFFVSTFSTLSVLQ